MQQHHTWDDMKELLDQLITTIGVMLLVSENYRLKVSSLNLGGWQWTVFYNILARLTFMEDKTASGSSCTFVLCNA